MYGTIKLSKTILYRTVLNMMSGFNTNKEYTIKELTSRFRLPIRVYKDIWEEGTYFEIQCIEDVDTSHYGKRVPEKVHERTIQCNKPAYNDKTLYVIMDDIYTTGTQFHVCVHKLENSGIRLKSIVGLMIGRTVSDYGY